MKLQRDIDLSLFNTFHTPAKAKYFLNLSQIKQIQINLVEEKILILGLGANLLFTKDFSGLVIKNNLKGVSILKENHDSVIIQAASGENWHDLVEFTVNNGWSGIENLAFIPSTVGAAVTQNIAAYGQNLEDVFCDLEAFDLKSFKFIKFTKADCRFSYRDSIFKNPLFKKNLITSVKLKLSKKPIFSTNYHSRYESLAAELIKYPKPHTPKQVFEAVIKLRQSKLPDWTKIPTAGSFFRNPVISKKKFTKLSKKISQLQSYPLEKLSYANEKNDQDLVKIPAGRLLDELGWKGKKIGKVGTYYKNALVIINLGGSTGQEIFEFSEKMRKDCLKNYGIDLKAEVNII